LQDVLNGSTRTALIVDLPSNSVAENELVKTLLAVTALSFATAFLIQILWTGKVNLRSRTPRLLKDVLITRQEKPGYYWFLVISTLLVIMSIVELWMEWISALFFRTV
jgi:type IV secretory pathway VirB3-like protein